jgi:hypothetical protein
MLVILHIRKISEGVVQTEGVINFASINVIDFSISKMYFLIVALHIKIGGSSTNLSPNREVLNVHTKLTL